VAFLSQSSPMELAPHNLAEIIEQPMLNLFTKRDLPIYSLSNKLYLVPTSHGETYDPDFAPNPSPLSDLPNLERWTLTYVVSVLEVMAGRRSPAQVARSTHRFTYNTLLKRVGTVSEVPKIKRIHRNQPIEGVIEVTVTLSFKDRVRAMVARFEGVDRKWLCTELEIL
jgi:hypothetical protein